MYRVRVTQVFSCAVIILIQIYRMRQSNLEGNQSGIDRSDFSKHRASDFDTEGDRIIAVDS